MFGFAFAVLVWYIPLPQGAAVLLGHTALTSEDGKQKIQLATFGFPLTPEDTKFLMTVMNSDPYLHHFRPRPLYLKVGGESFRGGLRLLGRPGLYGILPRHPRGCYAWSSTFTLPAGVNLTGTLTFHDTDGNSGVGKQIAQLELDEKQLRRAAIPFRARVTETGKYNDPLDDNREVHYLILALSHSAQLEHLHVGEAKPRRFPYDIYFGPGKGSRHLQESEFAATFSEAPPKDGPIRLRFHGVEGWYRAERVPEKPKK